MRITSIVNKIVSTIIIFLTFNTICYALICTGNPASALHPDNAPNFNNTIELDASSSTNPVNWSQDLGSGKYFISSLLISCTGIASSTQTQAEEKNSTFNAYKNSNISTEYKFKNLLQYYKIKGTSSPFLNDNAYIAFWYMDNRDYPERLFLSTQNFRIENSSNRSFTQGIKFNEVRLLFDRAPTILESSDLITNIPINIGTLTTKLKETKESPEVTTEQIVRLYLNVVPMKIKTCSVENQTVKLSPIQSNALGNAGSVGGKVNFTLTATCPSSGVNRILNAFFIDNYDPSNTASILKNIDQSNVGIQILNESTPIALGTQFKFGETVSLGNLSTTKATKSFGAQYYKLNNNTTIAGPVRSEAVITVIYD